MTRSSVSPTDPPELDNAPRLPRRFFQRDPLLLAEALLGQVLVRKLDDGTRLAGRIVEVEAYLGAEDRAAHSFGNRRTQRNKSMYLDAGHAYVYFTYGMHFCMNVVAGQQDVPTACLVRALEPLAGLERMRDHRSGKIARERLRRTDLCSGPAKLAQALAIDRDLDGVDLITDPRLYIAAGAAAADAEVVARPRVGVAYAGEWAARPYRLYLAGNTHVSVK